MIESATESNLSVSASSGKPIRAAFYLADQNPHRDRSLGITTMTQSLMDELAMRREVEMTQVISRSSFRLQDASLATHRLPFSTDRFAGRLLADSIHPWLARLDVDLWYYPKGYAPRVSNASSPCVGTMHDTIIQHYADHYPETRSKLAFRYWLKALKRSLETFDRVLTVSNAAAAQLRSFGERHRVRMPVIEVTYEGSTWEQYRALEFEKTHRVIHLASTAPHKRTRQLVRQWCECLRRRSDFPELLLVGAVDSETAARVAEQDRIRHMPRLQQEELRDLVGSCRALVLPSEIEGFGLPAIEAYYVGTPVCYVANTSVEEVLHLGGEPTVPGRMESCDADVLESAIEDVLSLSRDEIRMTSDRLFDRFATARVADRIVAALRRAVA